MRRSNYKTTASSEGWRGGGEDGGIIAIHATVKYRLFHDQRIPRLLDTLSLVRTCVLLESKRTTETVK